MRKFRENLPNRVLPLVLCGFALALNGADYPIRSAELTRVRATGGFWFDRLETNRVHTLQYCFDKCQETPRIANITNAAARAGAFGGIPFDDSDVFKVLEGAAYVLATHPDKKLESFCDWLIGEIAKAQELDGYLYTARTLGSYFGKDTQPWHRKMIGPVRWSNVGSSHELYNNGHMIEAACAWYAATGKRNFLDVAIKAADLIDRTFGPAPTQLKDAPGHEEIELALVKLFRTTGEERYLRLARHFIEMRGRGVKMIGDLPAGADGKPIPNDRAPGYYSQAHIPAACQREAVGHAVRAGYLYSGMADVAAIMGEKRYDEAIQAIWQDVVGKKLHLSGGIGAERKHEAFGKPYELPNYVNDSYMETCAAIANALWNERLFRATGEAKYIDVLERILYNGFLSGISLSGTEFFYPNPLTARVGYKREKWFSCSCCPVNDVRFLPQVPSMAYATDEKGTLYWNLFMASEAEIGGWKFKVETDYPWSGQMKMTLLSPPPPSPSLLVRIPGWAKGQPVPSDLYTQTEPSSVMEVSVAVNGAAVNGVPGKDGYLAISREWKAGDTVELNLPMPVKRIRAHEKVAADRGCLAVERGPLVYCAEGCDHPEYGGKIRRVVLPENATFSETAVPFGDKTVVGLRASTGLKLVPYCLWDNREPGNEMQVWFKSDSL